MKGRTNARLFFNPALVEAGLREELGSGILQADFSFLTRILFRLDKSTLKIPVLFASLLADETIRQLDEHAEIEHLVSDGEVIGPGTTLLKISAAHQHYLLLNVVRLTGFNSFQGLQRRPVAT